MTPDDVVAWQSAWALSKEIPGQMMAILSAMVPGFLRDGELHFTLQHIQKRTDWSYRKVRKWLDECGEGGWLELEEYTRTTGAKWTRATPSWPSPHLFELPSTDCTHCKGQGPTDCTQCNGTDCTSVNLSVPIALTANSAAYKARTRERGLPQEKQYVRSVSTNSASAGGSQDLPLFDLPDHKGRAELAKAHRLEPEVLLERILHASGQEELDLDSRLLEHVSAHWLPAEIMGVLRPMARVEDLRSPVGYLRRGLENIAAGQSYTIEEASELQAGANTYTEPDEHESVDASASSVDDWLEQELQREARWKAWKESASQEDLEALDAEHLDAGRRRGLAQMSPTARRDTLDAWRRKHWEQSNV